MTFLEQGDYESKYHFQHRRECFGYDGFTPEDDEEFTRWWNNLSGDARWKSRVESWFVEWERNFIHKHLPEELNEEVLEVYTVYEHDPKQGTILGKQYQKKLDEYENHIKNLIRKVVLEMKNESK